MRIASFQDWRGSILGGGGPQLILENLPEISEINISCIKNAYKRSVSISTTRYWWNRDSDSTTQDFQMLNH